MLAFPGLKKTSSANAVVVKNTNFVTFGGLTGPSYSGVRFSSDGNMYKRQALGGWSSIGAWLLRGTASDYYIQRVIESGTLTTDDGDGLQLNADRTYDIQQSTPFVVKAASVSFEISTDAPGVSVVAGPIVLAFSTSWETGV